MPGDLFVFSAPSGSGKSTIISALIGSMAAVGYSVSHTSRRPRGTEKDGIDYHFVSKEKFDQLINEGAFVEWAKVHGEYYGTSFSSLEAQTASGRDVLLDLDIQGAGNIKRYFNAAVLIFVLPPSMKVLEKRLKDRGTDSEDTIAHRMKQAANEISVCEGYDYIIINDGLDEAVAEARAILTSQRCKAHRRVQRVKEIYGGLFA